MALKNALGGVAFIAGTAVGATVLVLPVETAHLGIWQAATYYFIAWVFMTLGALFLLEVNLCVGYGSNLITMAKTTLGKFGAFFTWIVYLVLLYALTAAYLTGAGSWLKNILPLPEFALSGPILAAIITCIVIFLGTLFTDWCNRLIMIGLIASFVVLTVKMAPHIHTEWLSPASKDIDVTPIPLMINALGFAIIVPTLADYLHGNAKQLCGVIILGSLIPICMYLVWQCMILGAIPLEGAKGLLAMQANDRPEVDLPLALQATTHSNLLMQSASMFSIFALVSSIFGVTLSLFDFLSDGLRINKSVLGKIFLCLITFVPPLLFLAFYPKGFTKVLSFAGIFVAILLGILPALMVWRARYSVKLEPNGPLFGGRILILSTIVFFVLVILLEINNQLGLNIL